MKKTHEQFLKDIKVKNGKVKILGKYQGAKNNIKVQCLKCNYVWEPRAYSLLNGRACPKCRVIRSIENNKGKTRKKTHKEFVNKLLKINNNVKIISKYISHHDFVSCVCKLCNNKWEARSYSLLQGHGCPRCAKSGTSFMEQFIRFSFIKALSQEEVLSRDKKTIGMELDVFIPKLKIAIEAGNWFLHKKSLKRDAEKRKLCKNKGIRLITIYDKFPKNEKPPFKRNCIVFNDDYNKADHKNIKNLVLKLFKISKIKCNFNSRTWNEIEVIAYQNAKAKTPKKFVLEMKKINPTIEILEPYTNSNRRILVRCKKCDFHWKGIPASLLSGDGCRKCGTKKAHEKFIKNENLVLKELKKVNPNVEIIGKYIGRHHHIKTKCKICGLEWEPVVASLLKGSSHKGSKTIHKKMNLNPTMNENTLI